MNVSTGLIIAFAEWTQKNHWIFVGESNWIRSSGEGYGKIEKANTFKLYENFEREFKN